MTPAVKDDSSDIPLRIESIRTKHFGELFADSSFIIPERSSQQFRAPEVTLLLGGVARKRIENLQGEDDGRVWTNPGIRYAGKCQFTHFHVVAGSFKPAAAAHPHLVQKSPIP